MNFLRNLFSAPAPKERGLIIYVKPKACAEILRVRVDTMNELSRSDDESGFFVRKLARGARCPFQVEIEMSLDQNKAVTSMTITNGTEATAADYEAFIASQAPA